MTLAAVMQVMVTANTSQATAAMGRFQRQLLATEATAVKRTQGIARAFRTGGLAVGLIGAASGKMAIEFDRNMRNVNSIADLSERQFRRLEDRVRELAGPTAQSPRILAEGLYDLVSSGFDANESMKILAASSRAATAGITTTEIATKAVASVLNAYRRPAEDARQVSDDLFQTVNLGIIRFDELAQVIGDALPFAAQMGVNIKALGAAITTMTRAGLSPAETVTRLKNVLVSMIKPSDALKEAYKELGVVGGPELIKKMGGGTVGFQRSIEAIINTTLAAGDLKEAYRDLGVSGMDELIKKTGSTGRANAELAKQLSANAADVAQLFPNIRALGGALSLTAGNTKGAEQALKGFQDTAGATSKVFAEQSKSVALQWNKTKASVEDVAIGIGNNLLPHLFDLMQIVTDPKLDMSEKFTKVFDRLFEMVAKLIPKAIDAGIAIGEGLIKGILNASFPVQLLTGLWLFKAFGGFTWLSGMARAQGARFLQFFILEMLIGTGLADAGMAIMSSLGAAMKAAAPYAIAAIGLGSIIENVIAGDERGALVGAGTAAAGALAGGLIGSLPGALIGGGIGGIIGSVVEDLFGGGKELSNMQERMRETSKSLTDALEHQKNVMKNTQHVQERFKRAKKNQAEASDSVRKAERKYTRVLEEYPAKSLPALNAHADLIQAKKREARATKRLEKADDLRGVQLKAEKEALRATYAASIDRIDVLRQERENLKRKLKGDIENIKTYGRTKENVESLTKTQDELRTNTKELAKTLRNKADTMREATELVGPKFARFLENSTSRVLRLGKRAKITAKDIRHPLQSQISNTGQKFDLFGAKSDAAGKALRESVKSAARATEIGMGTVRTEVNNTATGLGMEPLTFGVSKGGKKQRKRLGGAIVKGTGVGDKVPALLEPGEVVWNKKAVMAMGGARAADSVNKAFRRDAQGINKYAQGINKFRTGGIAGYPGVTGDTDFVPALGHALSRMAGATGTNIFVQSGGRSLAEQAALFAAYQSGAGNPAAAPDANAPHVRGIAADITPGRERFGSIAGKFGLGFTVPSESWHVELLKAALGARGASATAQAIKQIMAPQMTGPDGALKSVGQSAFDKAAKWANKWLAENAPVIGPGGLLGSVATGPIVEMAKALVKQIWGMGEWSAFNELEMREAGWNPSAVNPSSGAAGLAQALPPSKYPPGAWPYRGLKSAKLQLQWMMGYIKERYGTPSGALSFHDAHNWYRKGGIVHVGDSLSVGMKAAGLGTDKYKVNAKVGRTSSQGIEVLKQMLKQFDPAGVYFDLGGNDGSGNSLASSLARVKEMIGGRALAISNHYLKGKEGPLNAVVNGFRRADAKADWFSMAKQNLGWFKGDPQGVHPTPAGYSARKRLVRETMKKALKRSGVMDSRGHNTSNGRHGLDPDVVSDDITPDVAGLRALLHAIPDMKGGGDRHQITRAFIKGIKKIGIPKWLDKDLGKLRSDANIYASWADMASQMNDEENGIFGMVQGVDEEGWLKNELNALFQLRNRLIEAGKILDRNRKKVEKILREARKQLRKVQKEIRQDEKEKKAILKKMKEAKDARDRQVERWEAELDKELAKPKRKQDQNLIQNLRAKIRDSGSLEDLRKQLSAVNHEIREGQFVEKAIQTVIPKITEKIGSLKGGKRDILSELEDVQGPGSPLEKMSVLPDVGVLGGDIFAVQMRLREIGVDKLPVKDDPPEVLGIDDLLRFAEAAQLGAFGPFGPGSLSQIPNYAQGGIHRGGLAVVGERGIEIANFPAGTKFDSTSRSQSALMPELNVEVNIGVEALRDEMEVVIRDNEGRELSRYRQQGKRSAP